MKLSRANTLYPVLNSYSALFFSQNKLVAVLLMLVSFLNPAAGISGLACVIFAIATVEIMGFHRESIFSGLYSFNNLLLGIGFGTFYHLNTSYWIWLSIACLFTTVLTLNLSALLGKYNLPVLSIPFILTFWAVLTAFNGYPEMGLEQKMSSLMNELDLGTASPLNTLSDLLNRKLSCYPELFFRALSSILFQDSVLAGMVIAVAVFIHSRISFSLLVAGFFAACGFNAVTGVYPYEISHYHLGANFMMTCCAIGGFFLIPSVRSYLWALISIPISFLAVTSLTHAAEFYHLPVFSLPFSFTTIGLLYFFMLRVFPGKLNLTPLQHYSPEKNLYQFKSDKERLADLSYVKLSLPFMGSWTVSQGYDGDITHKGEWSKAIDFVIIDEDGSTYKQPGMLPEHFYCYNKPVLACADGTVEEVLNHIDDNTVGEVNTTQNWGNTVVIKHFNGLFSKVSHLKKGSVKVKAGDFVKRGDLIAICGNSGRSPEPHLHFQVQATPYIGSKTIEYPFAYFSEIKGTEQRFVNFKVPAKGVTVAAPDLLNDLKQAFSLPPGTITTLVTDDGRSESWEVFTDAYNTSYLYCQANGATAWFINNGTVFYFTHFLGDKSSLLYLFYLAAYKVIFSAANGISANDHYPLDTGSIQPIQWINDFISPFYNFIENNYSSYSSENGKGITICSTGTTVIAGRRKPILESEIGLCDHALSTFSIHYKGKKINAKWTTEN